MMAVRLGVNLSSDRIALPPSAEPCCFQGYNGLLQSKRANVSWDTTYRGAGVK